MCCSITCWDYAIELVDAHILESLTFYRFNDLLCLILGTRSKFVLSRTRSSSETDVDVFI